MKAYLARPPRTPGISAQDNVLRVGIIERLGIVWPMVCFFVPVFAEVVT